MKKVYHLRSWVKTLIIIIILYGLFVSYLFACSERITQIENNKDTTNVSVSLWR